MIKHLVMFKLKDFAEGASKAENTRKIVSLLSALPDKISEIKLYEIKLNEKPSERASDILLISGFDSMESLNDYIIHPEHQAVANFIMKVREFSTVVDYTE